MTNDTLPPAGSSAPVTPASTQTKTAPQAITGSAAFNLDDIQAIVDDHALWRSSEGKDGKRANFRGVDLTGIDLSEQDLVEANLRNVNLTNANLSGAFLQNADLSESVLENANLTDAQLAGAALARARMTRATAQNADFTGANLMGVTADSIILTQAKFSGAILRDGNFRHAELGDALLQEANLRGAILTEANLANANLTNADCRDVNFDRTLFTNAILKDTNFRGAKLGEVDLQSADFSVALDIATEFQEKSLQSERAKLQEEQAQLLTWRSDLETREKKIAREIQSTSDLNQLLKAKEERFAAAEDICAKLASGFTLRFVLWLLICLAVLGFTVITLMDLQTAAVTSRAALLIGAPLFLLLLAGFSMGRSLQLAKIIKRLHTPPAPAVATVLKEPVLRSPVPDRVQRREPARSKNPAIPSTVAPPKKPYSGFGKKR